MLYGSWGIKLVLRFFLEKGVLLHRNFEQNFENLDHCVFLLDVKRLLNSPF